MFERNRIDTAAGARQAGLAVEMTLEGGEVVAGVLATTVGRSLADLLNGAHMFLDFEPYEGERMLVAKSAIRTIKAVSVPATGQLKACLREIDGFQPGEVLGIAPGATLDEARHAYHRLAKSYHPDRFASAGLPEEVLEYLAAVARRLNVAYAALETADAARRRAAARLQPNGGPAYQASRAPA